MLYKSCLFDGEDHYSAISWWEVVVGLRESLELVAGVTPSQFGDLRRDIDAEWVVKALNATGTATIRHRRLPAEQVVWLVIGMALFRNRSIHDVANKLNLALPGATANVARSTVAEARVRLGDEPMEWLFKVCAEHWAHRSAGAHRWRGLALYGVDGSTLRVPDSTENAQHFGYANGVRGESAYPMVRLAVLMALRSHLLAGATFGPFKRSELALAADLWPSVPNDSLTMVDKGFFSAAVLLPLAAGGNNRHWLIRAKRKLVWRVIRQLSANDQLVEMDVSRDSRRQDQTLPRTWQARAITYRRKGFQPQILLTSLRNAEQFPAAEIVALYHERWELELGFDEIKTEMLDREEAIRSKSPMGIRQELWGVFLAYNLVRREMERTADAAGVDPTRVSFVGGLRLICDEWLWCAIASPGAIPKHLRNLQASITSLILPPRRPKRLYPRAVKLKLSPYPRERRSTATTPPVA